MGKLRISTGLVLHDLPVGDVWDYMRRALDFHKAAGFDAGDLSLNLYTNLLGEKTPEMLERGMKYAEQIGLPIELCHLPFNIYNSPQEVFDARLSLGIDCAKQLGIKAAAIHPPTDTLPLSAYDPKQQHEQAVRLLAPHAEHAARLGVQLALENMRPLILPEPYHRYCMKAEELCAVADELGMGVCWDFGHANIAGAKQSEELAIVGKRLKMLHVNDNHGTIDVHLPPWMGKIDWADAMKGLADIGFDGLLNYELIAVNVPVELRESYTRYAMEAAHKLNELIG